MKKIFTLIAVLGILSVAAVKAQDFPSDPGDLMVDLELYASDIDNQEDSIRGYAPDGAGTYQAGTVVEVIAKEIPGYTFRRWSDEVEDQSRRITLTESMTLVALYEHEWYTITFVDGEQILSSSEYRYGDQVTAPEEPVREATAEHTFTFGGWEPEVAEVTGTQTYMANWDTIVNRYEIRFVNWDGMMLESDTLEYGAIPQFGGNDPTRETEEGVAYQFAGWEPEIVAVTGAATYTAQFTSLELEFTVHFLLYERDSVIIAHYNDQLDLYAEPAESDYFVQWSDGVVDNPRLVNIVSDTTFQAQFAVNRYEIKFLDWDETILQVDTLDYGTTPQYRGNEPTRETVEGQTFTFTGWFPEITPATSNATYTAQYTQETLQFTVTIVLDKDTTYQEAIYGTQLSLNAENNDERHFLRWQDGEQSAMRTVIIVSDSTFVAVYGDSHVDIQITAGQWNFICLPENGESSVWQQSQFNTDELGSVSWGTYNGAVRAASHSGWESVEAFQAKQGYILYSASTGRLRLNVYPENLNQTQVTTTLNAYESIHPENANWNFVGNPINAEMNADGITVSGTDEPTATIWNGTGYDNVLITTADFKIQPLQAFFIQTSGAGQLSFRKSDNGGMNGGGDINPVGGDPAGDAPRRAPQVADNSRIDIHATAGGYTDKSRVIFRANSSIKYEAGRDASKFVTASAPIQMYFLDVDNIKCAQMVRPAGEDNMRLGYSLLNAGNIEISMPVFADDYELYDALTDRSYDLYENVSIYSEKGTFNDRLSLRPVRKTPTAVENTAAEIRTAKVIINGQLFLIRDGRMFTVQGQEVR